MCATFKLDRNTSYAASHHKEKKKGEKQLGLGNTHV